MIATGWRRTVSNSWLVITANRFCSSRHSSIRCSRDFSVVPGSDHRHEAPVPPHRFANGCSNETSITVKIYSFRYSMDVWAFYLNQNALSFHKMGYAAAMGFGLYDVIVGATFIQWRVPKHWVLLGE